MFRHTLRRRAHFARLIPHLELMENRLLLATLLVNTAYEADNRDGNLSLREAIEVSNGTLAVSALDFQEQAQVSGDPISSEVNTIAFQIVGPGPQTIRPTLALPTVTHAVIIDGSTEPGFAGTPLIELDGSLAGIGVDGLTIKAAKCVVRDLAVNRFGGNGITLLSIDNVLQGNYIGTDVTGTEALGNGGDGVHSDHNPNTFSSIFSRSAPLPDGAIEGLNVIVGNLVSGNEGAGVSVHSSNGPPPRFPLPPFEIIAPATGALIQGNRIGTDVTGTLRLGNDGNGVIVNAASFDYTTTIPTTIGGTTSAARNLISGNGKNGILFTLANDDHVVEGNFIGTDITGTKAIGNALGGVRVVDTYYIHIGGMDSGAGNLISGNGTNGVMLLGAVSHCLVQGNRIGTDVTGTLPLGNLADGVLVSGHAGGYESGSTIGGTTSAARNLISGNGGNGIALDHAAQGITVEGNRIGTDLAGTKPLGNALNGVLIDAYTNLIGGTTPAEGNTIAFNSRRGVLLIGPLNGVLANAIFANGRLGIDVIGDGVTPELPGDPANPGYSRTAAPLLVQANSTIAGTTITGTLTHNAPNATFRVEFFANRVADPSGFGQGQTFLGAEAVTTDGQGNSGLTFTTTVDVPGGQFVTATATDPYDETSEFSRALSVAGPIVVPVVPVVPDPATIPRVIAVRGYQYGRYIDLTLSFSTPLNVVSAQDLSHYRLVSPGRDRRLGTHDDRVVSLVRAVYKPTTHQVSLRLPQGFNVHRSYSLTVIGGTNGVRSNLDVPLNGNSGGPFVTLIGRKVRTGVPRPRGHT